MRSTVILVSGLNAAWAVYIYPKWRGAAATSVFFAVVCGLLALISHE